MRPRGSITQRSPGSYRLRYSLGRDPSGKRKWGTATVRGTRKEAERELSRLLRSADTGEHVASERMTVGEWLVLWIDTTRAEVSPKTHERYSDIVRCYLIPAFGGLRLQRLTPSDISRAYAGFDRDPSPRTRRHIHRILKSALARAVAQQVLARNPADTLTKLPKVERQPPSVLTVEQSRALLAAIAHTTTYWPVLLALATGMRRGEILALRWRNISLDTGAIRVVESLEQTRKGGLRFKPTKTERARAVTLPGFALAELRRWQREQAEALLRIGVPGDRRNPGLRQTRRRAKGPGECHEGVHALNRESWRPTGQVSRSPAQPCDPTTCGWRPSEDRSRAPGAFDDHGDDGPLLPRH